MGEAEFADQLVERLGSFHRVQVFPLEVFDEGPLGGCPVVDVTNDCRDPVKADLPGSSVSSLACDDVVLAFASWAKDDRLHDPGGLDGPGEL